MASVEGAFFTAGPDDQFVAKGLSSIENKIRRMIRDGVPAGEATSLVNDPLRGSIIVHDTSKLHSVIAEVKEAFKKANGEIVFINKFMRETPTGYVGIHAKSYFVSGSVRLLNELQFHFDSIFDGTDECPKQDSHEIYEMTRSTNTTEHTLEMGNPAQKVLFSFGMHRVNGIDAANGLTTPASGPESDSEGSDALIAASGGRESDGAELIQSNPRSAMRGKSRKQAKMPYQYEFVTGAIYRHTGHRVWRLHRGTSEVQWDILRGHEAAAAFYRMDNDGIPMKEEEVRRAIEQM
uniref:Uncharacterized protein n=1 Tax=Chromera velia CCMP2878 TaxID=1169474 RepID=A0A0G4F4T4_9ALVE|eukprot:Cvel_170.t1-p1 / transcript=Cvel_170.t1 / gene=Cvel_170 / organism=Chromera_velia_CCMP2878 / gene_product=hypothetical protein / transcript_product=hypothetical protein / location=Cvel_scaffold10:229736-230611(+) / protein_length=292 / sequence_SO=supercontig / SO=protein_coding / is_pseudo=false